MKLLILTFSILFLASCTQYRYDVTYEKCNIPNKVFTGSYIGTTYDAPFITSAGSKILINLPNSEMNVCAFSYTREELK